MENYKNNVKSLYESLKKLMLFEIPIPHLFPKVPRCLKRGFASGFLSQRFLHEKEIFYSNLLIMIDKNLPLSEGLDTLKGYKLGKPILGIAYKYFSPSFCINLLTELFIYIFWILYLIVSFPFNGINMNMIMNRYSYLSFLSKLLNKQISTGKSLDAAMESCGGFFGKFEVSMIKSGIESGELSAVVAELKSYFKNIRRKRAMVVNYLIYPILLVIMLSLWTFFNGTFLLPKFVDIFQQLGLAFPQFSMNFFLIIMISMEKLPLALLLLVLFLILLNQFVQIKSLRYYLPVLGKISRMNFLRRLLVITGIQLRGGIPIDTALHNAGEIANDRFCKKRLDEIINEIAKGKSFPDAVNSSGLVPKGLVLNLALIANSENMPSHLITIAEDLNEMIRLRLLAAAKFAEPVFHLIVAIIIALGIISIYYPLDRVPALLYR